MLRKAPLGLVPSASPRDRVVAEAGAVPTPALSPGGVRGGGDSAVGRPQTPGEGGETRRGRGAGVSTQGKDKISRGAGGAAGPENRMSSRRSAPCSSARRGSGEGAGRTEDMGLPSPPRPLFCWGAQLLGAEGPHPVLSANFLSAYHVDRAPC
ncbi:PREDICTED: translation initiation factor IF-2-like [Rhinopithecus bieti]|uniref:translation initiation factor IF-2-like n=1 Tax=Rhinopithecus bieti TaxID=61621 RepID=UPI00083C6371|nr:PREDICTED: translation initiation factor IF-2-like [Rhinopithecus bieti]